MLFRVLLTLMLIGCGVSIATAQRAQQSKPDEKPDDPFINSTAEELRSKMAERYLEKQHKENLEHAQEVARLGLELKSNFAASKALSADDRKKVERLEKLTKRIRNDAGGSDSDLDPEIPMDLGDAINKIQKASSELNERVSSTPRLVVSAIIIERTNQLLQLVKYVRGTLR